MISQALIRSKHDLVTRLYLLDAIERRAAGDARKEDGNRLRIDLNFSF